MLHKYEAIALYEKEQHREEYEQRVEKRKQRISDALDDGIKEGIRINVRAASYTPLNDLDRSIALDLLKEHGYTDITFSPFGDILYKW